MSLETILDFILKGNCGPEKPSDFFCLLEREKTIRNYAKNCRSKACLDQKLCHFLFFWWRHLWQTFGKRLFLPIFSILKWKWKVIKPVCSFQSFFCKLPNLIVKWPLNSNMLSDFWEKVSIFPKRGLGWRHHPLIWVKRVQTLLLGNYIS